METILNVRRRGRGPCGFTLVELLVVMAIIAILLTLAAPRYVGNVDRAKEAVLRENLAATRDALEKYHADAGMYPTTLQDLVNKKYLRKLPFDPITERDDSWVSVAADEAAGGGIYDVHSGSRGAARDGTPYAKW